MPIWLVTHRRVVWGPGQEDPLVALVVGGVQAVEQVGGHVVLQQRQDIGVVLLVPLLTCLPGSPQH